MEYVIAERVYECPVQLAADTLGGKWKLHVIWHLSREEPLRFAQLRDRILGGISEKMLISTLKELQRDGLIDREAFPVVPPKVCYSLTERGRDLLPIVNAMADFGRQFGEDVPANGPDKAAST